MDLEFTTLAAILGVLFCLRRNNMDFLYNKQFWASLAVFFCFVMTSGQMWNEMCRPPLASQNGSLVFIHGSSKRQVVIETYIVMFLNAMTTLGMILLAESDWQNDMRKKRYMAIAGLILVAVFFSFLLSVFRSKVPVYPYSFLFK